MSGVLGLTKPANPRDRTGIELYRLNSARERLIKAGRPVGLLTRAELEEEAARWDAVQADLARQIEAERLNAQEQRSSFLTQVRAAQPGDVLVDEQGARWAVGEDGDLIEVTQS